MAALATEKTLLLAAQEDSNAFNSFKMEHGFAKKAMTIQHFINEEPGVDPSGSQVDMRLNRDEREAKVLCKQQELQSACGFVVGMCAHKPWRWKRWRMAVFTESTLFKAIFTLIIIINAVLIGVEADTDYDYHFWMTLEVFFVAAFVLELGLKLLAFQLLFFHDPWNILDFFIVMVSLVELVLDVAADYESTGVSAFRLVRIFRIVRVIGIVQRLNMLVNAFVAAMRSVVWVGVLMALCIYIFAILGQGLFKNAVVCEGPPGQPTPGHCKLGENRFGTVPRSMASLFQVLTLDSWATEIVWQLSNAYPSVWAFFIIFVLLASFGLLNLLTGVFIEALLEITKEQDKDTEAELVKQRRHLISLVSEAFRESDFDQGGTLDSVELADLLRKCHNYQDMLDFVGLSYPKMERACQIADYDHEQRSYWRYKPHHKRGSVTSVHHDIYRPAPTNHPAYTRLKGGPEGVMEGELVEVLTHFDDPQTMAEYYSVMKRIRRMEDECQRRFTNLERQVGKQNFKLNEVSNDLQEVIRLCGGEPRPITVVENVYKDEEEDPEPDSLSSEGVDKVGYRGVPLELGDLVRWLKADKDVPPGTVGKIVEWKGTDRAVVVFANKTSFAIRCRSLVKQSVVEDTQGASNPGAKLGFSGEVLEIGNIVRWGKADQDIPEGTAGKIVEWKGEDRAVVIFTNKATFSLKLNMLLKTSSRRSSGGTRSRCSSVDEYPQADQVDADGQPIGVGDRVSWMKADEDIPEGTLGHVQGFKVGRNDSLRAIVVMPSTKAGRFSLKVTELRVHRPPSTEGATQSGAGVAPTPRGEPLTATGTELLGPPEEPELEEKLLIPGLGVPITVSTKSRPGSPARTGGRVTARDMVLPDGKTMYAVAEQMFERYDLDNSGTINSIVELKQLVTNLLYNIGASPAFKDSLLKKVNEVKDPEWTLDQFLEWLSDSGFEAGRTGV